MPIVLIADEQDDISSLRTKLEAVSDSAVSRETSARGNAKGARHANRVGILVSQGNRALQSPIALKLLHRHADDLAIDLSIISRDPTIKMLAEDESLQLYYTQDAYERDANLRDSAVARVGKAALGGIGRLGTVSSTLLVIGFLLLVAGAVIVFLPVATVRVSPRSEGLTGNVTIVADPALREVDVKEGSGSARIPARVIYLLVDANDQMSPREGRSSDDGRAVGIVTLTNRNAEETYVPKGTVVFTPENVKFRTDTDVRLAPGLGQAGQTRIVALDPGPLGNVARLRVSRVEGILQNYVLVQNEDATAGGGSPGNSAVTADDQVRLRARVEAKAREESLAKLKTLPEGSEFLVFESVDFTTIDLSYDAEIGQETDRLGMRLKARVAATLVDLRDVETVSLLSWKPIPRGGYDLLSETKKVSPPKVSRVEGRVATLSVPISVTSRARINVARIAQLARWRELDSARGEIARAYELTTPPKVELAPAWASRAYRVDVIVETPPVSASSR